MKRIVFLLPFKYKKNILPKNFFILLLKVIPNPNQWLIESTGKKSLETHQSKIAFL